MSLVESLDTISAAKPKRAWLTHIAHEMDITKVEAILPPNVKFAYDTLTLSN
jgi:phosphoribosyl 1,2-cyclic phosphate phosphodiesterase